MSEKFEPDAGLIEEAERLLAEVRSGKVRAFACARVLHDDACATNWIVPEVRSVNFAILQAAIGQLNWRFCAMRQEYSEGPAPNLGSVK